MSERGGGGTWPGKHSHKDQWCKPGSLRAEVVTRRHNWGPAHKNPNDSTSKVTSRSLCGQAAVQLVDVDAINDSAINDFVT